MISSIGANPLLLGNAGSAYGQSAALAPDTGTPASDVATLLGSGTDTVTLSDAAKAYLAANSASSTDPATLAANARAWFDAQYQASGISSAMLNGQVAVDLTGQSRATLSAVASNSQNLFSSDETTTAAQTLQSRFDAAMAPHVVVARQTGNYAVLYQAASDYLDQAGPAERATTTWQNQKQAVADGLAATQQTPGAAPANADAGDPVQALLAQSQQAAAPATPPTDLAGIAANAHAMFDAQANQASDAGTQLVFNQDRKTGQQVDYSGFDNQTLAVVALNQDGGFTSEEARTAKTELDARTRASLLAAFDPSTNGGNASAALLQQYSNMSASEKSVLGYTDAFQNQIVQNYKTVATFQNLAASSASTSTSTAPASLVAYL